MEWWIKPKIEKIMQLARALIARDLVEFTGPMAYREPRVFYAGPVEVVYHQVGDIFVKYSDSDINMINWDGGFDKLRAYYNPHEDYFYDDVLMHLQRELPLDALSDL